EVAGDRVGRLVVATKAGLARVDAAVGVDASGDAGACHFAGLGYELAGELEPAQTLTTSFRMVNVDSERRRTVGKDEIHRRMREAAEGGGYELPRRDGSDHLPPVEGVTATIMPRPDSPPRGRPGGQRPRPRPAHRGRDGRSPPGAGVCPVPGRPGPRLRAGPAGRPRHPGRGPGDAPRPRRRPAHRRRRAVGAP